MPLLAYHGTSLPTTAKTPASEPSFQPPPRSNAPGPAVREAPARQFQSPEPNRSVIQAVLSGVQSATHSQRLPTMSKAPTSETQADRDPVAVTPGARLSVLHVVLPSSAPAVSGVPRAAACHSALVAAACPHSGPQWPPETT